MVSHVQLVATQPHRLVLRIQVRQQGCAVQVSSTESTLGAVAQALY